MPLQRGRAILVGTSRRRDDPGHCLELSGSDPRVSEDRELAQLLQRAGRPLCRRRLAGPPDNAVLLDRSASGGGRSYGLSPLGELMSIPRVPLTDLSTCWNGRFSSTLLHHY